MNVGKGVRCNSCRRRILPTPETEMNGELEITFFVCPFCGRRYIVAVTDKVLRERIQEYTVLAERNKVCRLSERMQRRVQRLKEANIARSKELRKQYLGEDSNGIKNDRP